MTQYMYRVGEKVIIFYGFRNNDYAADIFKIEMLFYQSKANLHTIILFGKITCLLDPEIGKML